MNRKIPELLAPAGSPAALESAVRAGADAVYLGMTLFNARMSAANFTRPQLLDAVQFAHKSGVRVYVTMNTTVYDRMLSDAMDQVDFLYRAGVDALIVADLGLAKLIHEYYPDFELHASTQCSGHNVQAAKYLHELGFSLMVCAREVDSANMAKLVKESPIPIEVFVHGALCVCASGQCLFSSLVGGRSGNRGECAQPCRLPYNNKYPLSLKDNCLASHITELCDMGVASLKIEGRMKSPEYVYAVTSVYRRLLDQRRNARDDEIAYLADVFSRGGFTDGYFVKDHSNMNGVRSDTDKSASRKFELKNADANRKPEITVPQRSAQKADGFLRKYPKKKPKYSPTARFYDPSTIPESHPFEIVYLPLEKFDGRRANGVILPPVTFDLQLPKLRADLIRAREQGAVHAMIGNVGQIEIARECGYILHGDFRLNVTSCVCAQVYADVLEDTLVSAELTIPQIRDISGAKSVIVYGRVPLMILEKSVKTQTLTDRRKVSFPVISEGGRDIVLNSVPVYMADKQSELAKIGDFAPHFIFTTEGRQEVKYIIDNYKKGLPTKKDIRRIK